MGTTRPLSPRQFSQHAKQMLLVENPRNPQHPYTLYARSLPELQVALAWLNRHTDNYFALQSEEITRYQTQERQGTHPTLPHSLDYYLIPLPPHECTHAHGRKRDTRANITQDTQHIMLYGILLPAHGIAGIQQRLNASGMPKINYVGPKLQYPIEEKLAKRLLQQNNCRPIAAR